MSMEEKKRVPQFRTFWEAYGMKYDRVGAERAWRRLSADDRIAACEGVIAYRERCRVGGVRAMYPQGYLTHRRWEDEQPSPALPSPVTLTASDFEDMETW